MKKLQNFKLIIDSIGIGGAALIADIVKNFATSQNWANYIPISLFVLVTIILIPIISTVGTLIVNNSKFLRKLILGNQFIEGSWTDYTTRNEYKKSFGIITIKFVSGNYIIEGNDYLEDGSLESSFTTSAIEASWPSILFVHKANRISEEGSLVDGFSQFTFATIAGRLTYSGWSVDYGKKAHKILNGSRISENEMELCNTKEGRVQLFKSHQ